MSDQPNNNEIELDEDTILAILRGQLGAIDPDRGFQEDDVLIGFFVELETSKKNQFWPRFFGALEAVWRGQEGLPMESAMHFLRRVHDSPVPERPVGIEDGAACLLRGYPATDPRALAAALGILSEYGLGERAFWEDRLREIQASPLLADDFFVDQAHTYAWSAFVKEGVWATHWAAVFGSLLKACGRDLPLPVTELLGMLLDADAARAEPAVALRGYLQAWDTMRLDPNVSVQQRETVFAQFREALLLWGDTSETTKRVRVENAPNPRPARCTPRNRINSDNHCAA